MVLRPVALCCKEEVLEGLAGHVTELALRTVDTPVSVHIAKACANHFLVHVLGGDLLVEAVALNIHSHAVVRQRILL